MLGGHVKVTYHDKKRAVPWKEERHARYTEMLPRSIIGADMRTTDGGTKEVQGVQARILVACGSAVLRLALATTGPCTTSRVTLAMVGHMTVEEE
jgi:hypothetical protein